MRVAKFDRKHYLPILKTKEGELWAIQQLSAPQRAHLTPLLEIHEHKTKPPAAHVPKLCDDIANAWGADECFLDGIWLHGAGGEAATLKLIFGASAAASLAAIPVIRTSFLTAALTAVREIVAEQKRGCMLRLKTDEIDKALIDQVLMQLNLSPSDIHLLVDQENAWSALSSFVPAIPYLADWKTFSVASGSFPPSLLNPPQTQQVWLSLPRNDWRGWSTDALKLTVRRPSYSDYATRSPGRAPKFGAASVNVRYATTSTWSVIIGGLLKTGSSVQMKAFCAALIARPEYGGPAYSAGDRDYANCALPNTGPGGPGEWVKWGVSHHLVFASDQVQALAGL